MLLWTVALFLTLELISNNVIEPWLYGASTGVSAIAIILAAIAWTTLWGPIGLLLSTPLTVCLAVMGRYIPQLRFLEVMLGSAPVLTVQELFYQRMLAGDWEEGEEIAKEQLSEMSLGDFYQQVLIPALNMAERDRERKFLTGEKRSLVTESFLRVVAALSEELNGNSPLPESKDSVTPEPQSSSSPPASLWSETAVLCVAGWTGLDRVAAAVLAQQLAVCGIGARFLPPEAISPDAVASLDLAGIEVLCVVYLSKSSAPYARRACLRLRRRAPKINIGVAFLNQESAGVLKGHQNSPAV